MRMRSTFTAAAAFGLAVQLAAAPASAGELAKPYFAQTPVGAWARHEITTPDGGRTVTTQRRLPDDDGRVRLVLESKIEAGAGSGTEYTMTYTLAPGFDLSRQALSFGKFMEAVAMGAAGADPTPTPANVIGVMREGSKDFRGGFEARGSKRVGERRCDRYAYRAQMGGGRPMVEAGEVCLDPTVPFGVVEQSGTTRDSAGSELSSFTLRLLDSGAGSGQTQRLTQLVMPPVEPPKPAPRRRRLTLEEAYGEGLLKIVVRVVEGSNGARLRLRLTNTGEGSLTVTVPQGPSHLEAGTPVRTLHLAAEEETVLDLAPAQDATLEIGQGGDWGALEGRFEITVYEGTPLLSGSVTVGPLGSRKQR